MPSICLVDLVHHLLKLRGEFGQANVALYLRFAFTGFVRNDLEKGLSPTYEQAHVGERPFDPGILHINFVHQFQLHIVADTQTVYDNTGCTEFFHEIYQFVILIKHILMMSFVALIHFKTVRECWNGNHTLAFFLILNPVI